MSSAFGLYFFLGNIISHLVNIDVTFGELFSELLSQVVALAKHSRLGVFDDFLALKHLIFVCHQSFEVLSRQQHKVTFVRIHLIGADSTFPGNKVKKLVGLLSRALLLLLILLNQLGKLRGTGRHCTLTEFFAVICLCLTFEFGDNLILLADLEVKIAHFILQDYA